MVAAACEYVRPSSSITIVLQADKVTHVETTNTLLAEDCSVQHGCTIAALQWERQENEEAGSQQKED